MRDYNLNFYEALKLAIEENLWFRGDDFKDGVFVRISKSGIGLVAVDANDLYSETPYMITHASNNQKYRIINVATIKELSK